MKTLISIIENLNKNVSKDTTLGFINSQIPKNLYFIESAPIIIGILLVKPNTGAVSNEILNNLEYFHYRAKNNCHFYLPGYEIKLKIDNSIEWTYNNKKFVEDLEYIKNEFGYTFTGETELLILSLKKNNINQYIINNKAMFVFNLEEMLNKKIITSVRNLFEKIFNFCDKYTGNEVLSNFQVNFLKDNIIKVIVNNLLSKYPIIQSLIQENKYYRVITNTDKKDKT